jgi:hypothetical protein
MSTRSPVVRSRSDPGPRSASSRAPRRWVDADEAFKAKSRPSFIVMSAVTRRGPRSVVSSSRPCSISIRGWVVSRRGGRLRSSSTSGSRAPKLSFPACNRARTTGWISRTPRTSKPRPRRPSVTTPSPATKSGASGSPARTVPETPPGPKALTCAVAAMPCERSQPTRTSRAIIRRPAKSAKANTITAASPATAKVRPPRRRRALGAVKGEDLGSRRQH